MADATQQDMQEVTAALRELTAGIKGQKTKGTKAGGAGAGAGPLSGAFISLYKTVSDSNAQIQKPFSQAGSALQDIANIAKGGLGLLPFTDNLQKFVGVLGAGGKLFADHNQKLLDFSQDLAGSSSLSIDSFSELTKQLSTANVGFEDFKRVQATSANFLSSMGGNLRDASGQAKLFADVTNVVNDDFEKLGQMGLSLADKQGLMAETMDTMRQIGMASGTDAQTAAAAVSNAMQNMAMESNKMAALTGKDRRKTLEAMAEKVKGDTSVAVSAKMIADQQGLTAEQTANLRTSLAAVETNIENAFPGAMGADMQAAVDMAARTGIDFDTALGKINPELAVALSKNKEFSNGMTDVINTLREGGEIDVANLGELNKKFESSVDKNYLTTMQMTSDGAALSTNIYEAMVAINAQSTDAAKNVEIETEKLKEGSAGQAANMAQVMKDGLTQAENVASVFLTMGTELFNNQFADNAKNMRDNMKSVGSEMVAGVAETRDVLMGVRRLANDTTGEMQKLLGDYSDEEVALAKQKLGKALEMLNLNKEEHAAFLDATGLRSEHEKKLQEQATEALNNQSTLAKKARSMIADQEKGYVFTTDELKVAATEVGTSVKLLSEEIARQRAQTTGVQTEIVDAQAKGLASTFDSLSKESQKAVTEQLKSIDAAGITTEQAYDDLIKQIAGTGEISEDNLGAANAYLQEIRDKDNSQKIVDAIIKLNTESIPSPEVTENTQAIIKLTEKLNELGVIRGNSGGGQVEEGVAETIGKGLDKLAKRFTLFD